MSRWEKELEVETEEELEEKVEAVEAEGKVEVDVSQ